MCVYVCISYMRDIGRSETVERLGALCYAARRRERKQCSEGSFKGLGFRVTSSARVLQGYYTCVGALGSGCFRGSFFQSRSNKESPLALCHRAP